MSHHLLSLQYFGALTQSNDFATVHENFLRGYQGLNLKIDFSIQNETSQRYHEIVDCPFMGFSLKAVTSFFTLCIYAFPSAQKRWPSFAVIRMYTLSSSTGRHIQQR